MSQKTNWWCKSRRAQSKDDFETWIAGGVTPTLNAMDNNGEAYATVLISESRGDLPMIFGHTQGIDVQASEVASPTLRANGNGAAVVFPIDDAREIEKHQNGTGIGDEGAPAYTLDTRQAPAIVAPTLSASNNPSRSPQSSEITAQVDAMVRATNVVRRLTPTECERLQGFPDGWTGEQADSNRYKQMGNAVAVPVVSWIVNAMVSDE